MVPPNAGVLALGGCATGRAGALFGSRLSPRPSVCLPPAMRSAAPPATPARPFRACRAADLAVGNLTLAPAGGGCRLRFAQTRVRLPPAGGGGDFVPHAPDAGWGRLGSVSPRIHRWRDERMAHRRRRCVAPPSPGDGRREGLRPPLRGSPGGELRSPPAARPLSPRPLGCIAYAECSPRLARSVWQSWMRRQNG